MTTLDLPEPCPICGAKVVMTDVTEWETESGKPLTFDVECSTEPDIDGPDWWEWHRGHYSMPYVDWLPYELRAQKWLQQRYRYDGSELERLP